MSRILIKLFGLASREVWLILGRRKLELRSRDNCQCTPLKRQFYHKAFSTFGGYTCTWTPSTAFRLVQGTHWKYWYHHISPGVCCCYSDTL